MVWKVTMLATLSLPYFSLIYWTTSSLLMSIKSTSISGIVLRYGLRNLSNCKSFSIGSIWVISRRYETKHPAALPRPQPTKIPCDDGSKHFAADSKRIDDLEESMKATNRIIIESLQALTAHAIDGNNTQELKDVKKSLNNYLINMV